MCYTVSPQLDELASTLVGDALNVLADDGILNVLLVIQMQDDRVVSLEFCDDSVDRLLQEARDHVRTSAGAKRYALAYEGAIEDGRGAYADALIIEFGERGRPNFSAFCLFEGRGSGDAFRWTEPEPAGEVEPLLT